MVAELNELGMPGKVDHIELPGHPVPSGIAFARDGKTAYVAFSRNNTVAVIDTATRKITRTKSEWMCRSAVARSSGRLRV